MVARIAINAKHNELMVSGQQADLSDPGSVKQLLDEHADSDALRV